MGAKKELTSENKNGNFIQIYRSHIDNLSILARYGTAFDLFVLLIKHMDGQNALSVSYVTLEEIMGVSRTTISRAVKYLKENGFLEVLKNGNSNVYIVNPELAWTSYDNQKKYCKFTSNVLLSQTENAEYLNSKSAKVHYRKIDNTFIQTILGESSKKNSDIVNG